MTNFARIAALLAALPIWEHRREPCPGGRQGRHAWSNSKARWQAHRRCRVYLRLPDGAGPSPAVVLLHGCGGGWRRARRALGQAACGVGLRHADHGPLRNARHHERLHGRTATIDTARRLSRAEISLPNSRQSIRAAWPWWDFPKAPCWRCSRSSAVRSNAAHPKNSARQSVSTRPALASRAT